MPNIKRLEELAQHLETGTLGHKVFDFATINGGFKNECGTNGCALGELPALYPNEWEWDCFGFVSLIQGGTDSPGEDAMIWFNVGREECNHLFYPDLQDVDTYGGSYLHADATRQDVASNIREFIKIKTT